jgi:hypothetical protein
VNLSARSNRRWPARKTGRGGPTWFPIDSKVTDSEIEDFEKQIGYPFPADLELIYEGHPREFLIDKGHLPFADWSEWGLLCFDTNVDDGSHNYPIVLWDHEIARKVSPVNRSFRELMSRLEQEQSERTFE